MVTRYMQYAALGALLVFVPVVVLAAPDFAGVSAWMTSIRTYVLTPLISLFIAVAVVLFVWGMVVWMANAGNDQARTEGKKHMIWGIVILFVALSFWGFVELLQEITGIEDTSIGAPPLPA